MKPVESFIELHLSSSVYNKHDPSADRKETIAQKYSLHIFIQPTSDLDTVLKIGVAKSIPLSLNSNTELFISKKKTCLKYIYVGKM